MSVPAIHHNSLLVVTALASAGAGAVHGAVAPEHTNWWASVAFFVALAAFQLGWAGFVVLGKAGVPVLALGTAVNLLALATWAVSRIGGLPFGPHQGEAEPVARADLIASVLGVVVALGALGIGRQWERPLPARVRPALPAAAGGIAVCALSVVALTGVSDHGHLQGEHDHASVLNVQATAATQQLSPAAAAAHCRRAAQVANDAALATAGKAAKKKLKRALVECGGEAAAPAKQVVPATAHPDDGHSH